jgi:deoxyribonuclease V
LSSPLRAGFFAGKPSMQTDKPTRGSRNRLVNDDLSHRWDVTAAQAKAIQEDLRGRVITRDAFACVSRVAGVDVGFEAQGEVTRAAIAVLSLPGLELVSQVVARRPTTFPYIPGLLSFREIPAVLDALEELETLPDLLFCDGQGLAHPRRFGIACHLGVLTDIPSIGVAKTRLLGEHAPLGNAKGSRAYLYQGQEIIGAVLRTRRDVKPLYISSGHRVSLETALGFVLACTTKYRLPETTRWAHRLASH